MIEIKLTQKEKTAEICAGAGLEYTQGRFVYEAFENGKRLGYCVFDIDREKGGLLAVQMSDEGLIPIADGLLRSALSLMYDRGVEIVKADLSIESSLLQEIGFHKYSDGWNLNLEKSFFAGC